MRTAALSASAASSPGAPATLPGRPSPPQVPEWGPVSPARRSSRSTLALRVAGALALGAVVVSSALLAAGSASHPNYYVPGRIGGWPSWLAGPFQGLGISLGHNGFQTLTLVMGGSYLVLLLSARVLSPKAIALAILAAHVVLMLGPPLISQDVFGYLGYARLGALHGLDPYSHVPAQAMGDHIYPFVGWPFSHPPYGPLFTLLSYAFVPLGVGGGVWGFKVLATVASLLAIWLTARAATRMGQSARFAAVFVGLNPVLLSLAVGGDHNDTLVLLLLSFALLLTAAPIAYAKAALPSVTPADDAQPGPSPDARRSGLRRLDGAAASLATAVGIKVSAGLVLPFLLVSPAPAGTPVRPRERFGVLLSALAALAVVTAIGLVAFGSHVLGFLTAVHNQQQMVAPHSIPAETARLFGIAGTPTWWRDIFIGGFVASMLVALRYTLRGADWRTTAGWATLALILCTAWLLPWYAIWPLPLAALSRSRALRAATLVFCAYALMVHLPLAAPLLNPPH
jgi:alpha-1,6-mannosyltransferase